MSDVVMSVLLIGISGVLLFAIMGWELVRKLAGSDHSKTLPALKGQPRLRSIQNFYKLVLLLFIAIGWLFFLLPSSQKYFGPIYWLDNDYVNATGFIILCIAFILIIRAQRRLDNQLHLYYFDVSQQGNSKTVPSTENHLLGYILLVYAGMFIVVSTLATGTLLIIALVRWYFRLASRKYKTPSQLR